MSNSSPSATASDIFFAAGLLIVFGFLVVILANFAEKESLEERAYRGDFDAETIATRWTNLEEVTAAQTQSLDEVKLAKAMDVVAETKAAPAASDIVVPGSPTFMKQMEKAAEKTEAAEPEKSAPAGETGSAPAKKEAPEGKPEATPAKPSVPESGGPEAKTSDKAPTPGQ